MSLQIFDYLPHCKPCLACCKNENIFLSDYEKQFFGTKTDGENCHNLMNDGRCSIHSVRPVECRIFPLDLKNINGKIKWVLWNSCPATPFADISFYEKEILFHESYLTSEWVSGYIQHHEKNEPEKYSNMNFSIMRDYKENK